MSKRKIIIVSVVSAAVLLCTVAVAFASAGNAASDWLNTKIVSRSEAGIKLSEPEEVEDESVRENIDELTKQFNRELIYKYKNALRSGYVYQYEMFMNDQRLHDYRFVHSFTEDELIGAEFSEDYSRIIIQGVPYVIKWGYPGDLLSADSELPDLGEWTVILRVFTEQNWREGSEIFAREIFEGVRDRVVIPLSEGGTEICSNEDDSLIRILTDEEVNNAEVSENGVFVKINGEMYIVNYKLNERHEIDGIKLKPTDNYRGDAGALDPAEYKFFSIEDWLTD